MFSKLLVAQKYTRDINISLEGQGIESIHVWSQELNINGIIFFKKVLYFFSKKKASNTDLKSYFLKRSQKI